MSAERFKLFAAVYIFFINKDKILLLKRHNTGYEDGKYSVVAGHLDGNEQVKTAAIREAKEECGVDIAPEDIQVIQVMHRKVHREYVDFFLVTKKWTGEIINTEPEKCSELKWADLNELPKNIIPYIRQAIENYKNDIKFDYFGWTKL